jgi:hypothetical protein
MPAHQLTSVRPVDLFENDPARIWVLTYQAGGVRRTVVGLFNWSDTPCEISVTAPRLGLRLAATYAGFEFWSNRMTPPFKGRLEQRLPARSGEIIAVREIADHPVVLGTSRHATQGAVDIVEETWDASRRTLSGTGRVVGGDAYEVRILATARGQAKPWQAAKAEVSQEDHAAGVTLELSQHGGLVRAKILSPATRTVRWSVSF